MNDVKDKPSARTLHEAHRALAKEHAHLKARVAEYTARRFLSPGEQLELNALRVMKLRAKDRLHDVATRLAALEGAGAPR